MLQKLMCLRISLVEDGRIHGEEKMLLLGPEMVCFWNGKVDQKVIISKET